MKFTKNLDKRCYCVLQQRDRFITKPLTVKDLSNININLNYNDDFPHKELLDFVDAKSSGGVALLYGKPGTGKSSYIKYLVLKSTSKFFLMDPDLLSGITSSQFLHFLTDECQDGVIVLEDCEKLLVSRDDSYNNNLSTLLNLSDGLLGDALNLKFICTFNTELNNIDKALQRKGRLKINYELKELTANKVNELAKSIGIEESINKAMTLADIYNYKEKIDFNTPKQTKKIGF